jgi:hypothetical protein
VRTADGKASPPSLIGLGSQGKNKLPLFQKKFLTNNKRCAIMSTSNERGIDTNGED